MQECRPLVLYTLVSNSEVKVHNIIHGEVGGGGGGAKNKVENTIPNFEELIESIINMLLLFFRGSR